LNSGLINIFSEAKTPQELALLQSVSADGTVLYGGKYDLWQFDVSVAGTLFELPAGAVKLAVGADYRREGYSFNGSAAAVESQPEIFNVAFDNANALDGVSRTVKAVYGELLIPIFDMLEVTAAARLDDYTGFGTTFNPKFTAKFEPTDWLLFRGSYNTGFRVPTFNQIFNGVTQSPNPGNTLVDPTTCPGGAVGPQPGCQAITPDTLSGGKLDLGPETSEQYSVGVVIRPAPRFSLSVDYWSIAVDDVIGQPTLRQALDNIAFLPAAKFVRNAAGTLVLIDLTADNIGSRRTEGLEFALRGGIDGLGGSFDLGLDGTWLLEKKENLAAAAPLRDLIGKFTYAGDLGLEWKHNAWVTYNRDDFTITFSQIFRSGYENQALPGIANGTVTRPGFNPRVDEYVIYNLSLSQRFGDRLKLTAGVKNLFDTDPPFAITYDSNTGAGSSWEPRVADPRGRSFTMLAEVRF
jgi:iron complex outermembrane recepter protein